MNGITYTGNVALKKKIMRIMQIHELAPGLAPYQLTWAPGTRRGWSFGWIQFDLASGDSFGLNTFAKVLLTAKDKAGNYIIDDGDPSTGRGTVATAEDTKVRDLSIRVQLRPNQLTSAEVDLINAALESTAGRQAVDDSVDLYLDDLINRVNNIVKSAPANNRPFLQSDLGFLWLIALEHHDTFDVSDILEGC